MSKKYAHFLRVDGLPQVQTAEFSANDILYTIFAIPRLEDSMDLARQCARDGYGVISLCGAYTPDWAEKVANAAGPGVGVGTSSAMPQSRDAFIRFFGG